MEWKEITLDNDLKVIEVIVGTIEPKHTEVTEKDIEDSCEKLRSLGLSNVKARILEIKKV